MIGRPFAPGSEHEFIAMAPSIEIAKRRLEGMVSQPPSWAARPSRTVSSPLSYAMSGSGWLASHTILFQHRETSGYDEPFEIRPPACCYSALSPSAFEFVAPAPNGANHESVDRSQVGMETSMPSKPGPIGQPNRLSDVRDIETRLPRNQYSHPCRPS